MTEYMKLVDVTLCDGCKACMGACKSWNDLPADFDSFQGSQQAHENVSADTWNNITYTEYVNPKGNLEYLFRHETCLHCTDATCQKVCPESAISYSKFGTVVIDHDKCIGCGYCAKNCPFDIIALKTYTDKNGNEYKKSQKCTMCTDRLEAGLQPACVVHCHTGSLQFGSKTEMLQKAQQRLNEIKGDYPNANIYNPQGVGGTHTIYVLAEKPSVYGLPENPKVPTSVVAWKDYAQPIGKMMLGATTMAVVGAFISNRIFSKEGNGHEDDGGGSNE